jgi:MoxR-like ATPase
VRIRLVSQHSYLTELLSRALRGHGHEVEVRPDTTFESELRYQPTTALAEVTTVVEQIKPLLPSVQADPALDGADVELRLGEVKALSSWEVKLMVDSEGLAERLRSRLGALGFRDDGTQIDEQERSLIKYGGATSFARQVVRWLLAQEGVRAVESKDWSDEDDDIWIYARDPNSEGKTPKERYPVEIHGDDYERMFVLKQRLEARGFSQVQVRSIDADARVRFLLDPGPFSRDALAAAELREIGGAFLAEMGVDVARYPLVEGNGERGHARIDLPLGSMAAGSLRPYAGAYPDRWDVVLRTDEPAAVRPLMERLEGAGFRHLRVETLPTTSLGFTLRWGAAKHHAEVADLFRGLVEGMMFERDLKEGYALAVAETLEDEDARILVDLPLASAARMPFAERVQETARGFELSLKTPAPDEVGPLAEVLRALPWKSWELETEAEAEPNIQYGGAPLQLVEHVRDVIERSTGIRLPMSKDWGDSDDDIWVHMPRPTARVSADEDAPLDLDDWLAFGLVDESPRPLIEVSAERVRVGTVTLPRRQVNVDRQLVPRAELFAHYCIDTRTADTLLHLVESALLREPCLLEGETSVSKTSIVLYLGMLLDQPVVRLNLNGQTDTGELVGRYVPQDVASALPVDPAELYAASELLESESRMILTRAQSEGRTLTRVEVQQIMANERMTVHPWRWQDGLVVTAMKRGWWIVLDELNLAEPQILERLNPVLESHPSIVLTEHDNSVIGPGGMPVHADFRVFATMNPAEYAGRSALSPAYRDRWRGYRYVVAPGEAEYLAMLRFLVYGEQPDLTLAGQRWTGAVREAPMGALADVEGIDEFLRALARFHAALEEAVGRRSSSRTAQLGARRRDRYVFTRRGLLSVMEYLSSAMSEDSTVRTMRRAIARYYLGRVQPGADQRIVARLLDAAGIGPGTWAPERLDSLSSAPVPPLSEPTAAADGDLSWLDDDEEGSPHADRFAMAAADEETTEAWDTGGPVALEEDE